LDHSGGLLDDLAHTWISNAFAGLFHQAVVDGITANHEFQLFAYVGVIAKQPVVFRTRNCDECARNSGNREQATHEPGRGIRPREITRSEQHHADCGIDVRYSLDRNSRGQPVRHDGICATQSLLQARAQRASHVEAPGEIKRVYLAKRYIW
jgi:hypothetical protein